MNLKNSITTLYLLLISFNILAQGENNFWYINAGRAIDFNQVPPTFIEVSPNFFSEGPGTTVSDSTGNFLFHTNGLIVSNRMGEQMKVETINLVR